MSADTKWGRFWAGTKWWTYKYLGGIFLEEKGGHRVISIGRCMLLAILAWMFYFWGTWQGYAAITPEELAQVVLDNLPRDGTIHLYHIEFAAQQVIDALPRTTPPMLDTAFLTACGYVFGSKVAGIASQRLNRQ